MKKSLILYLVLSVLMTAATLNAYAAGESQADSDEQLIASARSAAPRRPAGRPASAAARRQDSDPGWLEAVHFRADQPEGILRD